MSNRNIDRLAKLNKAMPPDAPDPERTHKTRAGVGALMQRETTLSKLARGKQRPVQHLMHPPARVLLWAGHNRDYALLSAERCADLVDGFKRTGKQEFPAIVRRLSDDPEHDFELICGARRHWTAAHLGWDLLVEVRELTDRQAFILQDLENRDREDVSDYERAVDYQQALPKYFENNRAQMAKFLEIDPSNFAKLLDLAGLPKAVVEAYGDLRELKAHHGAVYKRLLADSTAKRRVVEQARKLKGSATPGRQVFAELKKAAAAKAAPQQTTPKTGGLTVHSNADGSFHLSIPAPPAKGDRDKLAKTLRKDFTAFLERWSNQ